MKTFEYTIRDAAGVHARPAGLLVNKAKSLGCSVTIEKDGKKASASRLFAVMGLGILCGDTVRVTVEADNAEAEETAVRELHEFFEANL